MRVDELISRMVKEYGVMPKGFIRIDFMNPDAEIYPVTNLYVQRQFSYSLLPSNDFKYEVEAIFKKEETPNLVQGQRVEVWEIGHVNHTDETKINMTYGQFEIWRADWTQENGRLIQFSLESDKYERGVLPGQLDR